MRALTVLLLGTLAGACVTGGEEAQPTGSGQRLSAEEFRQVLAQGTIRPVRELEGEDVFREPAAAAGDFDEPERVLAALEDEARRDALQGAPAPPREPVGPPPNPYLIFGERIKVYPDGTITKPFPLRVGTGAKMKSLIEAYGNFPLWDAEQSPVSTPETVKIENLENWDVELYQDLRNPAQAQGAPQNLADWLVVTTGFELMQEVESFINLFAAGVPQIEIEAKIVEITFTDALEVGSDTTVTWPGDTLVQGIESDTPSSIDSLGGLLSLAAVQNGIAFDAALRALSTRDNVSIISQPKIAVREGGRADILNTTRLPYVDIKSLNPSGGFNANLNYIETGVKLYVAPRVVGTQTVALNIDVEASQQSGDQVILVSNSDEITTPIISTRAAHTVVYLQPGQAVILGGLIAERTVERIRKTPLLGDIPVLRYLFRSRFQAKEQTNVMFFIRPRILRGAELDMPF